MALDWQNPNYFINQINPFQQQQQQQQQQPQQPFQFQNPDDILLSPELLCFDPLPPTLFEFDQPLFDPPPLQLQQPFDYFNHDFIIPNDNDNDNDISPFYNVDFQPPVFLPTEDFFSFDEVDNYSTQFLPLTNNKKQKLSASVPCSHVFFTDGFAAVPEFYNGDDFNHNGDYLVNGDYFGNGDCFGNGDYFGNGDCFGNGDYFGNGDCGKFKEGCGENYDNNNNKVKVVSAQSRAARERRRKITEKTHELGKLIPGGNKLNTAEMFQAASNYVKFMQAQLGILQSITSLHEEDDGDRETKLNNLPILSSQLVQEKLYTKEKCVIPLDCLPKLEEHCDYETKRLISQQINNLLH